MLEHDKARFYSGPSNRTIKLDVFIRQKEESWFIGDLGTPRYFADKSDARTHPGLVMVVRNTVNENFNSFARRIHSSAVKNSPTPLFKEVL